MSDYDTCTTDSGGETAENEIATLVVRTRSPHHYSPAHARTPVAGNMGHSRVRTYLEDVPHTQGRVSVKVADSPPVVRMRLSDHWCSRGCSGPRCIRSGDQRFHREGWERPPTPGESDSLSHRHIDHRVRSAPKNYIEGNRVLDDGSMAGYTQA